MRRFIENLIIVLSATAIFAGTAAAYIATFTVQGQGVKQSGTVKVLDKNGALIATKTLAPFPVFTTMSFAVWSTAASGQYFGFHRISSINGIYYSTVAVNTAPVASTGGGTLDITQLAPKFTQISGAVAAIGYPPQEGNYNRDIAYLGNMAGWIKDKTDNLPSDPASNTQVTAIQARQDEAFKSISGGVQRNNIAIGAHGKSGVPVLRQ